MASFSPRLIKQTALAKATQLETRVNLLVASSTTELSPVVVYLAGAVAQVSVHGDVSAAGTWTCPAGISSVQIECWGAGGGGGGGTTVHGGGGGGGGEYAADPNYAVLPGTVYTYAVGRPGQGGLSKGQGGWPGGDTIFDTTVNGVWAHGGMGGDGPSNFNGGTGSTNALHFDGGAGGVSSAGIASDNPVGLGSISNVGLWWIFKGTNTSNGALATVYDDSNRSHTGSVVNKEISGLRSAIISTPGIVPTQTPGANGNCAYFKQDLSSSAPSYVSSPFFGLGFGGTYGAAPPWDGSNFTVSAWVRGDQTLGTWSYLPNGLRNFGTILADCDYPAGFHTGGSDSNSSGFALYMLNNAPGFYLNPTARSSSSAKAVAGSSLPIDGSWHQVVGTFDGTTMKLYVDGTLAASQATTWTKFGSGNFPCTSGANPNGKSTAAFTGYMSNVYLANVAASSGFISVAYGSSPQLGGSGGGASGGSAATGVAGSPGAAGVGGAAGTAAGGISNMGGSGAGGNGGNTNVNGTNAPVSTPYGGGGGGAGAPSSAASVVTLSVPAAHSASYTGIDALGGNNGTVYDVSDIPQAGTPVSWPGASLLSSNVYTGGDPSSSFNGSFNGMIRMANVASQLAGYTVNSVTASVTVQSTNASVLPIWLAASTPAAMPLSLGSDADIATYLTSVSLLQQVAIPPGVAGRRITFDITNSSLITALGNRQIELVVGGLQGSPTYGLTQGAYSGTESFQWNSVINGAGSPNASDNFTFTLEMSPNAAGNKIGGDGAPGSLILSYIDPRYWPICAIEPAATTDSDGHTFSAGVTTDSVVGFDPTVITPPRVPETWHSLGSLAGGSGLPSMDTARYRYAPDDGGTLVLQISFFLPTGTVITGGQYAWAVTLPSALRPTVSATATHDLLAFPVFNFNTSNALSSGIFGVRINGKNASSPGVVSLVVNFTGTASGNSQNTMIARIPLT